HTIPAEVCPPRPSTATTDRPAPAIRSEISFDSCSQILCMLCSWNQLARKRRTTHHPNEQGPLHLIVRKRGQLSEARPTANGQSLSLDYRIRHWKFVKVCKSPWPPNLKYPTRL